MHHINPKTTTNKISPRVIVNKPKEGQKWTIKDIQLIKKKAEKEEKKLREITGKLESSKMVDLNKLSQYLLQVNGLKSLITMQRLSDYITEQHPTICCL